ncbi:hypothetical protein H8959_022428 [Pygathrix nigripes]
MRDPLTDCPYNKLYKNLKEFSQNGENFCKQVTSVLQQRWRYGKYDTFGFLPSSTQAQCQGIPRWIGSFGHCCGGPTMLRGSWFSPLRRVLGSSMEKDSSSHEAQWLSNLTAQGVCGEPAGATSAGSRIKTISNAAVG